jgi:hypothetical protein
VSTMATKILDIIQQLHDSGQRFAVATVAAAV